MLREWDDLPDFMKAPEVRPYWEILNGKKIQLIIKRIFDITMGIVLLIILAVPMIIIAAIIKNDSDGPIFYRQERVTKYGKLFRIHKFRTMVDGADKNGTAVTVSDDKRVTRVGARLRKFRLDELPQLIDVIVGDMSFVGTRPEVTKFVEQYKPEYNATLLMPAGITSEASIRYKNESELVASDFDYVEKVLPLKMELNLNSIKSFTLTNDLVAMIQTLTEIF